MDDIDYTKYGWVPPNSEDKSGDIDYTKYGYVPPQENEGLTKSLGMAPFRIGKDIGEAALQGMRKIPELISEGSTEIPGLYNSVFEHPKHVAGQFAAGIGQLGHNLLNTLHNGAEYAQDRLHLLRYLPKQAVDAIPQQRDISEDLNRAYGTPQYPGEKLARGLGEHALDILGTGKIASAFNPMKLSSGNIAKSIVDAESAMKEKYSGKNGLYNQLSDEAAKRGMTSVTIPKIDMNTIEKYTSPKNVETLYKFAADPNLVNAQKAISDLGFTERKLENKTTLLEPEKEQLKAVKDAKQRIQENMFKDSEGKIHEDLLQKHKEIQKGYAQEVIPYSKNKAIQEYKKGEKLADQLVKSLSGGKFPAQRGSEHTPLMIRRSVGQHPIVSGLTGIGSLAGLGTLLYNKLTNKENE